VWGLSVSESDALDAAAVGGSTPTPVETGTADSDAAPELGANSGSSSILESRIYVVPEGVTFDGVSVDGSDLLVTLPTGEQIRIEDADALYDTFEVDGLIFPVIYEEIIPEPTSPAEALSSGGNFVVDPGAIDPGLPITPLLPPTELAFGYPEWEEIFLTPRSERPEPPALESTDVYEDEDDLVPSGTSNDIGIITVDYLGAPPVDPAAAFTFLTDGLDGQLTSMGLPVTFIVEPGGDLVGSANGNEVIRITIISIDQNLDGTYTYTYEAILSGVVDHPDPNSEDDAVLLNVSIVVTNGNGQTGDGVFNVTINDDVPLALDDAFAQQSVDADVTGNVLDDNGSGEDTFGADEQGTPVVSYVDGSLTGAGALTLNADGSFVYDPAPGEDGVVTFQYRILDGDGDGSTATVTITLLDDAEPTQEAANAEVDEDGFAFANVDEPTALETDSTELLTATQIITIDYGDDVPVDIDAAFAINYLVSYDAQLGSGGQSVSFALVGGDLVGTIDGGATEVIRISITSSTNNFDGTVDYEYTVLLSQPIDHLAHDNEDLETLAGIEFTATDSDSDSVTGAFDVTVYDDVPEAKDDSAGQANENDPVTIDVMANDEDGADGVDWTDATKVVSSNLSGSGTLDYNDDGTFTYTPAAGEEGSVTFDYTIEDGDGDKSTATVTIKLQPDSEPAVEAGGTTVDEDGLGDANVDENPLLSTETNSNEMAQNTGSIWVDYGNDVPADVDAAIVLDDLAGYDTELTADGQAVVFAKDGDDLVGTIDGGATEVIRISINDTPTDHGDGSYTYTYTVTLSEEVDHPTNDNEDSVVLNGIQYTVTDGDDGDTESGTFDVTVVDDVPEAEDDTFDQTAENADVTGNVLDDNGDGGMCSVLMARIRLR